MSNCGGLSEFLDMCAILGVTYKSTWQEVEGKFIMKMTEMKRSLLAMQTLENKYRNRFSAVSQGKFFNINQFYFLFQFFFFDAYIPACLAMQPQGKPAQISQKRKSSEEPRVMVPKTAKLAINSAAAVSVAAVPASQGKCF
jgi:hypothetical protein